MEGSVSLMQSENGKEQYVFGHGRHVLFTMCVVRALDTMDSGFGGSESMDGDGSIDCWGSMDGCDAAVPCSRPRTAGKPQASMMCGAMVWFGS